MNAIFHKSYVFPLLVTVSLVFLLLVGSACSTGGSGTSTGSATTQQSASTTPTGTVTSTSGTTPTGASSSGGDVKALAPGVRLGVQPCPAAVKDPNAWNSIIPIVQDEKVERVSCANLVGDSSLQALVIAYTGGSGAFINAYVYTDLTSSHPSQLWKMENLARGDARISNSNTVLTAETDWNSSVNRHALGDAELAPDLFREFAWSSSTHTFVPIAFPGLFPDLTRYQAEADEVQVKQGYQRWKLDPTVTAQAFAATMLKWSPNAPTALISGGGASDNTAMVQVQDTDPNGGRINLTLWRLEGNTTTGIWLVTRVETSGITFNSPTDLATVSTPTTVTGALGGFAEKVGAERVSILDHTYEEIGHFPSFGPGVGNGAASFSIRVDYKTTLIQGTGSGSTTEDGIVALYTYNTPAGLINAAVMVKVLLHA